MSILFIILLSILFIIFIIKYLIFNYSNKISNSYIGIVKLKWKQITAFYNVNPLRFSYCSIIESGWYHIETSSKYLLFKTKYNSYIRIRLSFIDYLKFLFFKEKAKRAKKVIDNNEIVEEVINSVRYDIEKTRETAQAQIDEATKRIAKVKEQISL